MIHALLHYVTAPLGIEPTISAVVVGGLFGLALVPLALVYGLLHLVEGSGMYSEDRLVYQDFLYYLGLPFTLLYLVQIWLLDSSHCSVHNAVPMPPRNGLEQAAYKFLQAMTHYFPMSVIPWTEKATLPTDRQYVFAVHPHGIHCLGLTQFHSYGTEFDQMFPGLVGHQLTGLAATVMFKIPLVNELFLSLGYVDASRSVANKVLECGRSLFICTGGEQESMLTCAGRDIVVLKKRKGFVRLALAHGADMVPVYCVGLTDIFDTYTFLHGVRNWLQKTTALAIPIFHGRFFSPLPHAKPIQVLIGQPIATPRPKVKGERPDETLVDKYHQKYIEALKALHAKHVKDRVLEIQ